MTDLVWAIYSPRTYIVAHLAFKVCKAHGSNSNSQEIAVFIQTCPCLKPLSRRNRYSDTSKTLGEERL